MVPDLTKALESTINLSRIFSQFVDTLYLNIVKK
jgi:hypothetical protein